MEAVVMARTPIQKMKWRTERLAMLMALPWLASGCMPTIQAGWMLYQPRAPETPAQATKLRVAVVPFRDERHLHTPPKAHDLAKSKRFYQGWFPSNNACDLPSSDAHVRDAGSRALYGRWFAQELGASGAFAEVTYLSWSELADSEADVVVRGVIRQDYIENRAFWISLIPPPSLLTLMGVMPVGSVQYVSELEIEAVLPGQWNEPIASTVVSNRGTREATQRLHTLYTGCKNYFHALYDRNEILRPLLEQARGELVQAIGQKETLAKLAQARRR